MSTTTISRAFVQEFGDDVHHIFQRQGSQLLHFLRFQAFQPGTQTRFYKMGRGTAVQKERFGEIAPSNAEHGYVDLTLEEWYAGDYIDQFDENKITIDERGALVHTQVYALGRRVDEIFRDQMYSAAAADFISNGGATKYSSSTAQVVDHDFMISMQTYANTNNVPIGDNQLTFLCGPLTWAALLGVDQFVNADYVGQDGLILPTGMTGKSYLGINWVMWNGISQDGNGDERNLMFHKTAVGFGGRAQAGSPEGLALNPDWDWIGNRRAWFVSHGFEGGAAVIDNVGALEVVADVTP